MGEYGATGTADIKAEYIWLMPEVGAAGPTGGDDGLGGYMPLATAVGQAGTLNWLHTHHHGAPILTTNATGAVVPYPAHAVLGFPGQFANSQQLAGAQHYYNRYRDYDVNTGRYIQADPIGLAGDDNPYAYARGNPLRYKDPSGEFAFLFVPAACVGGGCQAAVAATGALIGGTIAWTALHPMGKPDNVAPIGLPTTGTNCPDNNDECQAAIADASRKYNNLVSRRIPQYESGGTRGPDSGHYTSILEKQESLRKSIRKVRRVCANRLPPQLSEWERVANMPIQIRH